MTATTPAPTVGDWRPGLDLTEPGLKKFDASNVARATRVAREAGYQAGFDQATAAGQVVADQQIASARDQAELMLSALQQGASSLDRIESRAAEEFASIVVDTALELAQALIHRELHEPTVRAAEAARRALSQLDRTDGVDLQLHPDDVAALHGLEMPDGVRVVANPSINLGDAIALTADSSVDARISTALLRARRALEGTE